MLSLLAALMLAAGASSAQELAFPRRLPAGVAAAPAAPAALLSSVPVPLSPAAPGAPAAPLLAAAPLPALAAAAPPLPVPPEAEEGPGARAPELLPARSHPVPERGAAGTRAPDSARANASVFFDGDAARAASAQVEPIPAGLAIRGRLRSAGSARRNVYAARLPGGRAVVKITATEDEASIQRAMSLLRPPAANVRVPA
ncbi:MAG TPA: hypothetical protein VH309_08465, partial [Elusimicrobiota bacterium]|nr:hypothetical protein [Elusimicrobiota bacterium]